MTSDLIYAFLFAKWFLYSNLVSCDKWFLWSKNRVLVMTKDLFSFEDSVAWPVLILPLILILHFFLWFCVLYSFLLNTSVIWNSHTDWKFSTYKICALVQTNAPSAIFYMNLINRKQNNCAMDKIILKYNKHALPNKCSARQRSKLKEIIMAAFGFDTQE